MKITIDKVTWTSVGCAIALLAGIPAVADDTDLLLINPDSTVRPKPNVMFILDSSGSMDTEQETSPPYDPATIYTDGDCDESKLYFSEVDVVPNCATSENVFTASEFKCLSAQGKLDTIGRYTGTLAQFRDGGPNGEDPAGDEAWELEMWQTLAPGYDNAVVECQDDDGIHGDGDEDALWPAAGSDPVNEWADDPAEGLAWGSSPRNISYTVYSGNYLNWKQNPGDLVELQRTDIMKNVTKRVLTSVENMNVGLMRFDGDDGGTVILDLTDLDTNRQTVLDAVDAIGANGNTPLSETMFEAALYWRGMAARYGQSSFTDLTDPNALITGSDPETYDQPSWDVCAKNYNVMLSDGEPREDFDTPGILADLPEIGDVLGYTGCDGDILTIGGGQCLDDIAEYLSKHDLDPDTDEDQLVTTHTIGFTSDIPLLREAAIDSDGEYFLANDVESLTDTLLSIIENIDDRSLSFSAPAVSVNTFNRTQNLNDLYITTFGAANRVHWPGNLKKYRIDTDQIVDAEGNAAVDPATGFFDEEARSFWTTGAEDDGNEVRLGGAAQQLPDPDLRNLYTNNGDIDLTDTSNHVSEGNADAFSDSDFGLTGASLEPDLGELIRWARGEDVRNEDGNTETTVRNAIGDPLHAQPAAIVYGGSPESPETVIYMATNDGYLHAIDGASGEELWSFIPKQLLSNLTKLYFDSNARYKHYGLDGNVVPVVKDVDKDGVVDAGDGDFVYIIFGMRRGGSDYFALDVTDKTSPELLWEKSLTQGGESWSTPVVARMDINSTALNDDQAVVVFGGGYDTVHDSAGHPTNADGLGAGIHFLDLVTGVELWRAGEDSDATLTLDTTGREMNRAFPNEVRVLDLSGDGFADRMYTVDVSGQVWRFDIINGQTPANLVRGGIIARFGAEGLTTPTAADTRRFYNAPDVSLVTDQRQQRRYIAVSIGSGHRARPFDLTSADRFFSLRDPDVFVPLTQTQYNGYSIANEDDLVEVSGTTQAVITADDRGWKFTLPDNEKILADSLTFDDEIFFVAFSPDVVAAEDCSTRRGVNYLYRVSAVNGDPIVPDIETVIGEESDDERKENLQQGGIAPSPAILFPSPEPDCEGEECKPKPLYCVGVECSDPGFVNNPVRTLWTQDGIE